MTISVKLSWVKSRSKSCTLGMDNVNLTLLSTARHHQQLEEFNPHRQLKETEDTAARARPDKRKASLSPQREKKKRD